MKKIVVIHRADDYQAFLADHPKSWEAGSTREEAIGNLVISHYQFFNIAIEEK